MQKPNLVKTTYQDAKHDIFLECYADAIVYQHTNDGSKTLIAIRLGGYPEQVRAMSDAIYGGGTIRLEQEDHIRMEMATLTKRYERALSMDGVYAEATLFPQDDPEIAKMEDGEQETLSTQRSCYLLTPAGDRDRLLEEIDRRTSVPLIPEFRDYFLDALIQKNISPPRMPTPTAEPTGKSSGSVSCRGCLRWSIPDSFWKTPFSFPSPIWGRSCRNTRRSLSS